MCTKILSSVIQFTALSTYLTMRVVCTSLVSNHSVCEKLYLIASIEKVDKHHHSLAWWLVRTLLCKYFFHFPRWYLLLVFHCTFIA